MSIRFQCSACERGFRVENRHAGKRFICPDCRGVTVIPPAARPEPGDELDGLEVLDPPEKASPSNAQVSQAGAPSRRAPAALLVALKCPACQEPVAADAFICANCGFDRRTPSVMPAVAPPAAKVWSAGTIRSTGGQGGFSETSLAVLRRIGKWSAIIVLTIVWLVVRAQIRRIVHQGVSTVSTVFTPPTPSAPAVARPMPTPAPPSVAPGPTPAPAPAAITSFPDLGTPKRVAAGVDQYQLTVGDEGQGLSTRIVLYLPAKQVAEHSLPCVFIAPAGTLLFHGSKIDEGDSPEHLPYAMAGFAVAAYELSGARGADSRTGKVNSMEDATLQFMAAEGGVANARAAIEFVLHKVSQVDPEQLFAAGHSSAATVALDLGWLEPRIRGVCAYAPATDVERRVAPLMTVLQNISPDAPAFISRVSPIRHAAEFHCPVFLFHADNDDNVPLSDNQAFADALRASGKEVQFMRVARGGHYMSMIRMGVPNGIRWLIAHGAKPAQMEKLSASEPQTTGNEQ